SDLDLEELACNAHLPDLYCDMQFILALQEASLDDRIGLSGDALECLHNPPRRQPEFGNADIEYGVSLFLTLEHSLEDAFHKTCAATLILHWVKKIINDLLGVTSIIKDMCIDSYVAFVSPYAELDECPICQKP
ncbi:hypothetical protein BDR05DRAFT_880134, partial [Suillus weaverae]